MFTNKQLTKTNNYQSVNRPKNEMQRLNFFWHGHLAIYLITKQFDHPHHGTTSKQNNWRRGSWHSFNVLLILMLLSGDMQLNPGPSTNLPSEDAAMDDLAKAKWVSHWQRYPLSQKRIQILSDCISCKGNMGTYIWTKRHSRWTLEHGQHVQIQHLLTDSNLDFLVLGETKPDSNIPTSMTDIHGYTRHRKDRTSDQGWGEYHFIWEKIWNVVKLNWTHH